MVLELHNSNILNNMRLEKEVHRKFIQSQLTLSVAESCTGGLVGDLLTDLAGASAFFLLGIVAYDNAAKSRVLGIPDALIKKHGAVSQPVASAMAQKVRKILDTDVGLSITGIAGPGGGSILKPVGSVYIAISTRKKTIVKKFLFKGTRLAIKKMAARSALKMLAE